MHEDCIVRLKMVQIIEGEELVDFMKERIQECINELKGNCSVKPVIAI